MVNIDNLTFDEAMKELEVKIALLEKEENTNNDLLYNEAVSLKEHCAKLLKKEKEDIKKVARENNIPLSEIGLSEDDDDDEDDTEAGEEYKAAKKPLDGTR